MRAVRLLLAILLIASTAQTQTLPSPRQGGTGASNTATSGRYLKGDGTNFLTSSGSASGTGTCVSGVVTATNSDAAPTCVANGAAGGGLPAGTSTHTLRFDGSNWVDSSILQNDGTNVTDTGTFTAQGATSKFGTASSAHTTDVGQGGSGGSNTATLRVRAGNSTTAAIAKIQLMRHLTSVAEFRTDGTNTFLDYIGVLYIEAGVGGTPSFQLDANGNMAVNGGASGFPSLFNVGQSDQFQVDATGNVAQAGYLAGVNTKTAPALSYNVPTGYVLEPPRGTQHLVGAITARLRGTARSRGRDENKNVTLPPITATRADYSFTVATLNQRRFFTTFYFQGATRGTVQGSGNLRGMDEGQVLLSTTMPGSLQIASGEYREFARRQYLQGNARIRLQGGAFLLGMKS